MKKVLIPCDGSEASKRALQYVADLPSAARPQELQLLNVQDNYPVVYDEYISPELLGVLRDASLSRGDRILEEAKNLVASTGIPVHVRVVFGDAATTIVDQVDRLGCDHVVMGSRGLGAFKSLVIGSVATKVIHGTRVPVTLIR